MSWGRKDHADPGGRSGAGRDRAGHLADVHDRAHLQRAPAVSHLDLYRLAELDQEDPALLEDYVTPEAVAFIEWPGVAEPWLENVTRRVEIRHAGGDERQIVL